MRDNNIIDTPTTDTDISSFYSQEEITKLESYKKLLNNNNQGLNDKEIAQKKLIQDDIEAALNLKIFTEIRTKTTEDDKTKKVKIETTITGVQVYLKEEENRIDIPMPIGFNIDAYKKQQMTRIETGLQKLGVLEKPKTTLDKLSDLANKVPIVQDVVQMFRPISSLGKIAFGNKEEGVKELKDSAKRLGNRAYSLVASPIVSAAAAMSGVVFKIASKLPVGAENKEKYNQRATESFALAGKEGKEFAIAAAKTAGLAAVAFAAATPFGAGAIAVAGAGAAIGVATGAISTVAATGAAIGGAVVGTGSMVGSTVVGAGLAAAQGTVTSAATVASVSQTAAGVGLSAAKGTVASAATVASASQTAANVVAGVNTADIIASAVMGTGPTVSLIGGVIADSTPKTNNPTTRARSNAMSK